MGRQIVLRNRRLNLPNVFEKIAKDNDGNQMSSVVAYSFIRNVSHIKRLVENK